MEIFINELSLHGQYSNEHEFAKAINYFATIFKEIEKQKMTAFKDGQILLAKQAIQDKYFQESLHKIRDISQKRRFERIIYNRLNPKDWRDNQIHDSNIKFICKLDENQQFEVQDTTLAEVTERNIQDSKTPRILINFIESKFKNKSELEIYKETNQYFLKSADDLGILLNWLNTSKSNQKIHHEFLIQSGLFESTNMYYPNTGENMGHFGIMTLIMKKAENHILRYLVKMQNRENQETIKELPIYQEIIIMN